MRKAKVKKYRQLKEKDSGLRKISYMRKHIMLYFVIAITGIAAIPLPSTLTKTFSVPYTTQYIQSSEIELGETQINQQGSNGQGLTKTKLLSPIFAYIIRKSGNIKYSMQVTTETTQAPVNKVVANGTKKYQYMWCSNGSYRYYTNDQFKNALTGFTHKSPDNCAENKAGHMTQLSDAAPPTPTTIYKTAPTLPTRTTTHCYNDFLGGVTCSTY